MCGLRWCLACDIPFHHGETCEERRASERLAAAEEADSAEDERDLEDELDQEEEREQQRLAAFDREADEQRERDAADLRHEAELKSSEVTRVCPGCHIKVYKVDGCDHMTCKYHRSRTSISTLPMTTLTRGHRQVWPRILLGVPGALQWPQRHRDRWQLGAPRLVPARFSQSAGCSRRGSGR